MNPRTRPSAIPAAPPLTDAALDAALRDDEILPSSGFAASVMAAVERESAAPALGFPWKRALPGLIAAGAGLVFFFGYLISAAVHALRIAPHVAASEPAVSLTWRPDLQLLLHSTASAAVFWAVVAVVLSGFALLLCRRLLSIG